MGYVGAATTAAVIGWALAPLPPVRLSGLIAPAVGALLLAATVLPLADIQASGVAGVTTLLTAGVRSAIWAAWAASVSSSTTLEG